MRAIRRRFGGHKSFNPAAGKVRACAAIAVAVPVLAVLALPGPAAAKKGTVTLVGSGSSAAQPYMLALFAGYHKLHPGIKFSYNPDGGSAGVTDVQQGRSQFAIQTAAPVASNTGTHFYKLFLDALCIDVNNSNSTSDLSIGTVRSIFLGIDTAWSQVGGGGSGTIALYGRNATAGLYTFFKSAVLAGRSQASDVTQEASDSLVATQVASNRSGIGYVGLSHSTTSGQKPVQIGGVSCTAANVRSEKYPLTHWDWAVLPTSHPSAQVVQFVEWVETSSAAGKIANRAGAVWQKEKL